MKISCRLSRPIPNLKGYVAVVIDVLRATSNLSAMFNSGAKKVTLYTDYEEAKEQKMYDPKLIVAGESGGTIYPGFDMGNSPTKFLAKKIDKREVAFCTTNGTKALAETARKADITFAASLLNLSSTAERVAEITRRENKNVAIICSGIEGDAAVDDLYVAGAMIHKIISIGRIRDFQIDDGVTIAKMVYGTYSKPMDALIVSESGKRLSALSKTTDIALCAKVDLIPGVLRVTNEDKQTIVNLEKEDV